MAIDIFPAASLAFALAVSGGIIYLLWKLRHNRALEQLSAYANSLPQEERLIFWRLLQNRGLWNTSRYPKAFRRWRRESIRSSRTASLFS